MKAMRIGFWPLVGAVIVLLVGGSVLFSKVIQYGRDKAAAIDANQKAIAANRELGCRIGGFLVDTPITKQPGTSKRQFHEQIQKATEFLQSLGQLHCRGLGHVTRAKIHRQLATLKGGGHGTGNPHPPGGQPGGRPPAAPPPPQSPPPKPPGPPHPPPARRIERTICHLSPLGVRICIHP